MRHRDLHTIGPGASTLQARFFEDEIHPNLKHMKRGLLGMAGEWDAMVTVPWLRSLGP